MIGISTNQKENGTSLFVPLTTMHAVLTGRPADVSDFWVQTTSHDHAFIDRTTTGIEDTLTAHGYDVSSEIVYARLANETASNRTLTTTLAAVGLLVVAISMAGLANALTMSVRERTREIGILRSIGARARDIRRIFATETLTLAAAGWLIGIPLGYLLDRFGSSSGSGCAFSATILSARRPVGGRHVLRDAPTGLQQPGRWAGWPGRSAGWSHVPACQPDGGHC